MKKLLLVMSASLVCMTGLTADERQAANAQRAQPKSDADAHADAMAAGYYEALTSYLAQGGSIRTDKRGSRYMEGQIKGLTKAQATEKFKALWATTTPAVRQKYAARALSRGATAEVQLEQLAAAERERQELAARRQAEQREQRERAMRESATVMRSGNRITLNGDQTSGYRIQGDNLYEFSSGAHTHVRSGNLWVPINDSHPQLLDP